MELKTLIDLVQENGPNLSKKVLREAVSFAKKSGSAELAYELACVVEGKDRQKMEGIVLLAKEPKFCYLFARDIPGADVKAHEKVILAQKDVEYAVEFASDIVDADVIKLSNIVLESKNPEYAYKFALEVELLDGIENTLKKDVLLLNKIANNLNLYNYKNQKNAERVYKQELHRIALNKANKLLNNLQQIVIDSRDGTYIELFKRDIEGADIKKLNLAKGRITRAFKTINKNIQEIEK